ncbi:MAG: hypothetical protein KDD76_06825, partial [Rickettsiales bacterium]|nr:hypothetical protein [Rickettsiales bacterium]
PLAVAAEEGINEITAEEIIALKEEGKPFKLIDARGGEYFDGTVIEGAMHLSAEDVTAETLAEIAPNKEELVVFYCTNVDCPASLKSAAKAQEAGYANVAKYKGGIEEWKEKGLPTETLAN